MRNGLPSWKSPRNRVENKGLKTPSRVVYGEGAVHLPFTGSLYMSDESESQEIAEKRYAKTMTGMGFVFLPNLKRQ